MPFPKSTTENASTAGAATRERVPDSASDTALQCPSFVGGRLRPLPLCCTAVFYRYCSSEALQQAKVNVFYLSFDSQKCQCLKFLYYT